MGAGTSAACWTVLPLCGTNELARQKGEDKLIEELLDSDQSGEDAFRKLSREERMEVLKNVSVDERLDFMKLSSRLLLAATLKAVAKHRRCEARDIEAPRCQARWEERNTERNETAGVWLPLEDEQSSSKGSGIVGTPLPEAVFLRTFNRLPIVDTSHPSLTFETEAEGTAFGQKLLGGILPKPRYAWPELASDEAQAKLAYGGLGQLLLRSSDNKNRGEHVVDLRQMASLAVRPSFESYGAAAYFTRRRIEGIFWSHGGRWVAPGEPGWEHAKYAWRVSLFTWLTAADHLAQSHLVVSNGVNAALRESLPPEHPVRRVLHASVFGTSRINASANLTLASDGCFLHRMSALQWEGGLADALRGQVAGFRFETWPQRFRRSSLEPHVKRELPIFADGLEVWDALHGFFRGYVDLYYPDEAAVAADSALLDYWRFRCTPQYAQGLPPLSKPALVDQLTHACFWVTCVHQAVGDVVQYTTTPSGMCFQVSEGQTMCNAEEMVNVMALTASTGRDMPRLMEDWSHLLEDRCRPLFEKLIQELKEVSARIGERNAVRDPPYTEMDPQYFECSVSI